MADKKQQDKSEWKVLKAWELGGFGWWGFLSGMWFWATETATKKETSKPEKEKIDLDDYFWTKETEQPVATASDIFNFASHSSGQKKKKSFDKPEKKPHEKKWESHKNTKPKWNIQIEHTEYVAKEKKDESWSDFFESIRRQNAEKAQREWKQPVQSIAKKKKSKSEKKHQEKPTNERAVQVIQASTEHHEATTSANLVKKSELYMDEKITLKEFSEKMWVTLVEIMKKLMENKIMTWINSSPKCWKSSTTVKTASTINS